MGGSRGWTTGSGAWLHSPPKSLPVSSPPRRPNRRDPTSQARSGAGLPPPPFNGDAGGAIIRVADVVPVLVPAGLLALHGLAPDQLVEVRRLWDAGESQQAIAAAIGVCVDAFKARLRDQLADLPPRPLRANSDRRGIEVTPEEIVFRAAECRARWTPDRWCATPASERDRLGRMAAQTIEYRG
jgi:hypothetical protein